MARILMAWELGGHLGHLTRLAGLADALHKRGHHITFALRELHAAESIFGANSPYHFFQAPLFLPTIKSSRNPLTYSEILLCNGYSSSQTLRYMVKAWQTLTAAVNPDLIIYDYSPTAMLANRQVTAPKIEVGTGFCIPPKESPTPTIRDNKKLSLQQRQATDDQVLKVINQVLSQQGIQTINHIYELFDETLQLLTSFPELECYSKRREGNYVGAISANKPGKRGEWPSVQKTARIFVYLKPSYEKLEALMLALSQTGADIRAYIPDCPSKLRADFESKQFQISNEPYAMDEILTQVDFSICHAGHDTIVHSLLAGTPLLLIPQYIEQLETARRVENLNAGIILYSSEVLTDIQNKMTQLLSNESYKENAKMFAERYRHMTVECCINTVLDRCELLIHQHQS